jgi:hypothetical protein
VDDLQPLLFSSLEGHAPLEERRARDSPANILIDTVTVKVVRL